MPLVENILMPGSLFGHYRIERPIGSGGMGTVYRATNLALESSVALKVIRADAATDEDARQRFDRERKLAAKLKHPHIVRTLDGGEEDRQPYVVMDVIEGVDLETLIRPASDQPARPLDPKQAAKIIHQVGSALDEAHRQGMIHRDVKPANILIADRDGEPWAYLTDFGLARLAEGASNMAMSFGFRSGTGQLLGTPYYMSPEQTRALKDIDWRTDIWSLGAVLYAVLTGDVPYQRDSWFDLLRAIVDEPFPPLPDRLPAARALNEVLIRAMAKRPEDRFQSAGELGLAALEAVESLAAAPMPSPAVERAPVTNAEVQMANAAAALLRTPPPASPESPASAAPVPGSAADDLAREMAAKAAAALLNRPAEQRPVEPQPQQSDHAAADIAAEAARRAAAMMAAGGASPSPAPPTPTPASGATTAETVKQLAHAKLRPKDLGQKGFDELLGELSRRLEPTESLLNLKVGWQLFRDPAHGLWALTNRRLLYLLRKGEAVECREWALSALTQPASTTWSDNLRLTFGTEVVKVQPANAARNKEFVQQINALYSKA